MKIKLVLRKDDVVKLEKEKKFDNLEGLSNIIPEYEKITDIWINEQKEEKSSLKKLKTE